MTLYHKYQQILIYKEPGSSGDLVTKVTQAGQTNRTVDTVYCISNSNADAAQSFEICPPTRFTFIALRRLLETYSSRSQYNRERNQLDKAYAFAK